MEYQESALLDDSLCDDTPANGELDDNEYVENDHLCYFKIIKVLGTGSSSTVVLGLNTLNNEQVAIKIIKRKQENEFKKCDIRIFREVLMSSLINHPFIVRLKDFMFSRSFYFLILEYVNGKQMYELIVEEGFLTEQSARRYFRQILSAIDFLHKNSIVHRDLKIENILLDENDNVKIIDFGLSNYYDSKMLLNTFCGSLYFAAPELLQGNRYCGPEIDIWSLGIILYVLLNGAVPFDDKDVAVLQEKIKDGKLKFVKSISLDAQDLISNMLKPNPIQRKNLQQVIESSWINQGFDIPVNNYFIKRYPLQSLNKKHVQILASVAKFQFKNIKREIYKYYNICINSDEHIKLDYWSKRPVICMYYMLLEIFNDDSYDDSITDLLLELEEDNLTNKIAFSDDQNKYLLNLNKFVNYIITKEADCPGTKYYKKTIFKGSEETVQKSKYYPVIKNTYFKGFFNGIKLRNIGTKNALKKILCDLLNANKYNYKICQKYFTCDVKYNTKSHVSFKISMYYNVILSEFYVHITHVGGEKLEFNKIYETIYGSLKESRVI